MTVLVRRGTAWRPIKSPAQTDVATFLLGEQEERWEAREHLRLESDVSRKNETFALGLTLQLQTFGPSYHTLGRIQLDLSNRPGEFGRWIWIKQILPFPQDTNDSLDPGAKNDLANISGDERHPRDICDTTRRKHVYELHEE